MERFWHNGRLILNVPEVLDIGEGVAVLTPAVDAAGVHEGF